MRADVVRVDAKRLAWNRRDESRARNDGCRANGRGRELPHDFAEVVPVVPLVDKSLEHSQASAVDVPAVRRVFEAGAHRRVRGLGGHKAEKFERGRRVRHGVRALTARARARRVQFEFRAGGNRGFRRLLVGGALGRDENVHIKRVALLDCFRHLARSCIVRRVPAHGHVYQRNRPALKVRLRRRRIGQKCKERQRQERICVAKSHARTRELVRAHRLRAPRRATFGDPH